VDARLPAAAADVAAAAVTLLQRLQWMRNGRAFVRGGGGGGASMSTQCIR